MTAWIYRSQTYRVLQQKMSISSIWFPNVQIFGNLLLHYVSHYSRRGVLHHHKPGWSLYSLVLMMSVCFVSFWYFTSLLSRLVFFCFPSLLLVVYILNHCLIFFFILVVVFSSFHSWMQVFFFIFLFPSPSDWFRFLHSVCPVGKSISNITHLTHSLTR